ncbi:MAG: nucleotide sugar dehydrogenase [Acidimicrobiales bacterium]
MRVAVVGLGKIGLPLSVQIAGRGHEVAGLDISSEAVATISSGTAPFPGEPELDERIQACLSRGKFRATLDTASAIESAEVVIVVVPLIVDRDRNPDFGPLDAATSAIAPHLRPGVLVSYETTIPVGSTRSRFTPALETGSGLLSGTDLFVCHSPERVSSGRVFQDLRSYPKLVGGIDAESAARAVDFYASALEFHERHDLARANGVWDLGSAEAAELAKLAETTYRDVNIAYANELAVMADDWGLDVGAVIEACNSQPFSHIHQPGISVGGHCIPVYPHFLMAGAPSAQLPVVARRVNALMPRRHVELLKTALGGSLEGRVVAVLGLAYRAGVKEHAFSGTFDVVEAVASSGGLARVHDPLYSDAELRALELDPHRIGDPCDAVILHTAHEAYADVDALGLAESGATHLIDGRSVVADAGPDVTVLGLGRSRERPGR